MGMTPRTTWARHRRVGVALLALMAILAAAVSPPQEAGAQSARAAKKAKVAKKATKRPAAAEGDAAPAPEAPAEGDAAPAPEAAGPPPPPVEHETVKLADGTEVEVDKYGATFPAYEYRPPLDIHDKRVHVVVDYQRLGRGGVGIPALEVDPVGGKIYWSEHWGDHARLDILRADLNGARARAIVTGRVRPRDLVLDPRRGRIYWLEGVGRDPATLKGADLDGKHEATLSKGLNNPFGLALDPDRGQLYYWEAHRVVRVNTDGMGEEVITTDPRFVDANLSGLAFDATRGRLIEATSGSPGEFRWCDRDGTHIEEDFQSQMSGIHVIGGATLRQRMTVRNFMFDDVHQKVYFVDKKKLVRMNLAWSQIETLAVPPPPDPDGWNTRFLGDVALDSVHGHLYWTGVRSKGTSIYATIFRTALPPLPVPTARPAPPRVAAVDPAEQATGGIVTLRGSGLAEVGAVAFIDDSTGAHVAAKFQALGDDRLSVTVPPLGGGCRRPVIVVRTPSGVTMTLGVDVLAPKLGENGGTYRHERSAAGATRLWFRTGILAGGVEVAVAYAARGCSVGIGPKGMATVFAKDGSAVHFSSYPQTEAVIYHEPFAVLSEPIHHDPSIKLIAVPAIRPSFPEQPFRYRADRRPAD